MSLPSKPLAGLKVVELGTLIAGPFASRICAEFGAQVVKVESPDGGDPLRKWRKLYEGTSLWWFVQARNKQSLTLNLKHPEGMAILKRLLADADILIENFRPGEPSRWSCATAGYVRRTSSSPRSRAAPGNAPRPGARTSG